MENYGRQLIKAEEFSPTRCQGVDKRGQCIFESMSGTKYCKLHQSGSSDNREQLLSKETRNYNLAKWSQRINKFADSSSVKSLREEIGIARMVLESILDRCQDANDIFLYSSRIGDHLLKIEKIVVSCHKLEQSSGSLLDKTTILQIANTIIEILGKHIVDSNILETIADEIITMIVNTASLDQKLEVLT